VVLWIHNLDFRQFVDRRQTGGLTEGTVTAKVLSSRKRREKEDRIGESQPFRKRISSVYDEILLGRESNPRPSAYKADELPSELHTYVTRLAKSFFKVKYKLISILT
jgi:hypothetical protein